VLVPDCVEETFEPETSCGGEDGPDGRGVRYLTWTWDPDPDDHTGEEAFALILRDADGSTRTEGDRHRFGMFPRASWLAWLAEVGFVDASSRLDPWGRDVFTARKPG
jgi:hypothetical protein